LPFQPPCWQPYIVNTVVSLTLLYMQCFVL
jgi:hypothetical protein